MIKASRDKELNEIFYKCISIRPETLSVSLSENSLVGMLTEGLDEADVKEVAKAIDTAEKQLNLIDEYFDALENFDRGKISEVNDYLSDLKNALERTRGSLAVASFKSGAISKFLGQKITLPQLIQASITIHTKAKDFIKGFSEAVRNIESNLGPLVKNEEDKTKSLRELSQAGIIPDEQKLENGIKKAMKTALGGGFFTKIKNFFTKAMTGAEKKIMDELPELNIDVAAGEIADAFLDSSIEAFRESAVKLPKPEPSGQLKDVAQESQKAEEAAAEQATASADTGSGGSGPPQNEKESKEEQDEVQAQLVAAVKDEAKDAQSPKDASLGALDSWAKSLSKSSQTALKASNRLGSLKDLVGTALDDSAKAVEGQVAAAIAAWREEHEETLIKGKRFAKKNFDELEKLISTLAGNMLKKSNESKFKLSNTNVQKIVFEFLNRKFYKDYDKILFEGEKKFSEETLIVKRMNRMAGLE